MKCYMTRMLNILFSFRHNTWIITLYFHYWYIENFGFFTKTSRVNYLNDLSYKKTISTYNLRWKDIPKYQSLYKYIEYYESYNEEKLDSYIRVDI